MVAKFIEIYGQVDFLFNSAVLAIKRAKFQEIDDDLQDRTYDLNVKGTFYAMQETIPHMLERGEGVIVNVASIAARMGGPASHHTTLPQRARGYANHGRGAEFADRGIRAGLSPPPRTPLSRDINEPGMLEDAISRSPMGRAGQPEEIGELRVVHVLRRLHVYDRRPPSGHRRQRLAVTARRISLPKRLLLHRRRGVDHRVDAARVIKRALQIHARRGTQIFLEAKNARTRPAEQRLAKARDLILELIGIDRPADDPVHHQPRWASMNSAE